MIVEDDKIIKEIKSFLDENNVEYKELNTESFCLFCDNPEGKRSYVISYVSSKKYPIEYPNYNIKGVASNYFYNLSHKAESEDNSFICWVKDYEWLDDRKREVLKSYFLHAAGKTKYKYYARNCEIREVETREARDFESVNCFYGKRGASLNLGLYAKKDANNIKSGDLLMIYTFGKNFFGKNNDIEVLRVGTKRFTQVLGGASKLLKYFIDNYPTLEIGKNIVKVERLKFYSDYDHNIGNSLGVLGFEFVGYSRGGFMNYWVDTGDVKGRQPNKHKWVMEQMSQGKVFAVPNAGVKVFTMDLTKKLKGEEYGIGSK